MTQSHEDAVLAAEILGGDEVYSGDYQSIEVSDLIAYVESLSRCEPACPGMIGRTSRRLTAAQ